MFLINWIKKAIAFFKNWAKHIPPHIKDYTEKALQITTRIKRVLDGDGVVAINALIPGDWDDKIVAKLKSSLPKIVEQLMDVKGCGTDLQCHLSMLLDFIREQAPKTRNSLLMSLAQLIVATLDDNELKESMYDAYVSVGYTAQKTA